MHLGRSAARDPIRLRLEKRTRTGKVVRFSVALLGPETGGGLSAGAGLASATVSA